MFISTCRAFLLISILFQRELADSIVVPLGDSAKFSCCMLDNLPIWIINNTAYESSSLPDDYYLTYENECFVMVTTEVKLWMNSTTYSCYSYKANKRINYHTVYVEFGFYGPNNTERTEKPNEVLLSCYSSILSQSAYSVIWIINSTAYNPRVLPSNHVLTEKGLNVQNINNEIGISYQCLLYSFVLYKDRFYHSNIYTINETTLELLNNYEHSTFQPESAQTDNFQFIYSSFLFNGNTSVRIEWEDATTCNNPITYKLIEQSGDITIRSIPLGSQNSAIINITNILNTHSYYVQAYGDDQLCTRSNSKILLEPKLHLQDKIASSSHQISLPLLENNTVIAWPKFNGSQESCLCYSQLFMNCSCFSTGNPFNVTTDNQNVYWHNLKNGTIILFIAQTARFVGGVYFPLQRIINAFRVINPSVPDAPVVISYGSPYTLCFSVDYEGQYEVLKYLANVTDNTKYTLSIEVSPSSPCKTLHLDSNNCGLITVKSQSENVLGRSLISSYVLNQDYNSEDPCRCFYNTFDVNLQNLTFLSNEITLNVSCDVPYNVSWDEIDFTIRAVLSGTMIRESRSACDDIVTITGLNEDTKFTLQVYWKNCDSFPRKFEFFTNKKMANNTYNVQSSTDIIIAATIPSAVALVLIIVFIVVCCYFCNRHRKKSTTNPG